MVLGEWKVHIESKPGRVNYNLYLYRNMPRATEFLSQDGKVVTEHEGAMSNPPYFCELDDEQIQAFADALANKGIKTRNDSLAEGKLAATERHLEDMRTLALGKAKK